MRRGQALSCRVICVLLLVFLFHVSSHGQVTTGSLLGTVQDPSGAAIHGAKVTATNLQTGLTRSALSGEDGGYAINLLPVGDYSIRVESAGFKSEERSPVTLLINSRARVDFTLHVGNVSEKVEVTGRQPVLRTKIRSVLTARCRHHSGVFDSIWRCPLGRVIHKIPAIERRDVGPNSFQFIDQAASQDIKICGRIGSRRNSKIPKTKRQLAPRGHGGLAR